MAMYNREKTSTKNSNRSSAAMTEAIMNISASCYALGSGPNASLSAFHYSACGAGGETDTILVLESTSPWRKLKLKLKLKQLTRWPTTGAEWCP